MPLVRKHQIAAKVDAAPGTPATLADANVIDTKSAEVTTSQEFLSREPSGGTLSRSIEAAGTEEIQISIVTDLKGSGDADVAPDYGPLIQAALTQTTWVQRMALATGPGVAVYPGDIWRENGGDGIAVVVGYVAAAATTAYVWVVAGDFATSATIDSDNHGAGIATAHGTTVMADTTHGVAYIPISEKQATFSITGAFGGTGTPAAGEGLVFRTVVSSVSVVVGEAIFVSLDGTTVTADIVWGTIPDAATVTSSGGGTATVDTPSDLAAAQAPTCTVQSNLDTLIRTAQLSRVTWSMSCDAGATGELTFTVTGRPGTERNGARFTAPAVSTTAPRFAGGYAAINGIRFPVKNVGFDSGNSVVQIPDGNSANGIAGGDITDRAATITIEVEQTTLAGLNLFALRRATTPVRIGIQIGSTEGNRLSICAPNAQITEISDGDSEGRSTHSVTLACRKFIAGDDEFIFCQW